MSDLAEESPKTQKAREKLRKQLEEREKQVTQAALDRKVKEIHQLLNRRAPHRMILKSKNICLFDENENAAAVSLKVQNLLKDLKDQNR